jgi:hypothetical protein
MTAAAHPEMDTVNDHTFFRRVRTGVCPSLRADGQPITSKEFAALGIRFGPHANNEIRLGRLDLRCVQKRDTVGAGWAADVCTSSWQCACPFAPMAEEAPVFGRQRARWTHPLAARVQAAMTERGLAQHAICAGIGSTRRRVEKALSGRSKSTAVLEAIAAYLGIS